MHLPAAPLNFLYDIQTAVNNKLVDMPGLFSKSCNPISTLLRRTKFVFEEGIVLSTDNDEVVRHRSFRFVLVQNTVS